MEQKSLDQKTIDEIKRNLDRINRYVERLDVSHVPLKGCVVPMEYDVDAFHEAEMRIGLNNTWGDKLKDPATHLDTLVSLFTIFVNCGFRHLEGDDFEPLEEKWIRSHLIPSKMYDYEMTLRKVLTMGGETEEVDDSGERDLVLERIKKTKVNGGSHTAASFTTD